MPCSIPSCVISERLRSGNSYLSALRNPLVWLREGASVVVGIPFGLLAGARLRHELFEYRYAVYEQIGAFLARVLQEGRVPVSEPEQFLRLTKTAYFGLGCDAAVKSFIEEVFREAAILDDYLWYNFFEPRGWADVPKLGSSHCRPSREGKVPGRSCHSSGMASSCRAS